MLIGFIFSCAFVALRSSGMLIGFMAFSGTVVARALLEASSLLGELRRVSMFINCLREVFIMFSGAAVAYAPLETPSVKHPSLIRDITTCKWRKPVTFCVIVILLKKLKEGQFVLRVHVYFRCPLMLRGYFMIRHNCSALTYVPVLTRELTGVSQQIRTNLLEFSEAIGHDLTC